jgi:hypothetical protein
MRDLVARPGGSVTVVGPRAEGGLQDSQRHVGQQALTYLGSLVAELCGGVAARRLGE